MFKTKKSRIPAVYRILLVAIAVMAIGGIAVNCYVGNYYRADSIAEAAIDSDREVSVTIEKKDKRIQATQYDLKLKNYTITFAPQDKEKATKALIFPLYSGIFCNSSSARLSSIILIMPSISVGARCFER
jgi:mRNA degradation ribonuclease J1/J2